MRWTVAASLVLVSQRKKLAYFFYSSHTAPEIQNATGAKAVIEWEHNLNPRLMRAVLRAWICLSVDLEPS